MPPNWPNFKIFKILILQLIAVQSIYSFPSFTENGKYNLEKICGKTVVRKAKIVGGEDAIQREFPWIVHIKWLDKPHCGGALISDRLILTAAHCLVSKPSDSFRVKLGAFYTKNNAEEGVIEMPINRYYIHENFNRPRSFSNDIALIKINPINFTEQILPICLPSNTISDYENIIGKVAGFGWLDFDSKGKLPNSLQKVDLPIISNEVCENWFRENNHFLKISNDQFCAGYAAGKKDACKGDSGSPYMFKINNRTEVIGIVSAGIGCADPKMPGVYTRVSSYLNWIKHQMFKALKLLLI